MLGRPLIFVSAVSPELGDARAFVVDTLQSLGCDAEWEVILGTDQPDLTGLLCDRIDPCHGLIQLIGQRYGCPAPVRDPGGHILSYTQWEAHYATQRGKPVWYLLLHPDFPCQPLEPERDDLTARQSAYRQRIALQHGLVQPIRHPQQLQASVLQLRDEILQPRRRRIVELAGSIVLLLLLGAGLLWVKNRPHPQTQPRVTHAPATPPPAAPPEQPTVPEPPLPVAPALPPAAPIPHDHHVLAAAEHAARSAQEQSQPIDALRHFRRAADLTDPERDPLEWARIHTHLALTLQELDRPREAAALLQRIVALHQQHHGPEHPATLTSRSQLAGALRAQGQDAAAEQEERAIFTLRQRTLGPEHPDTLQTRSNLALPLQARGKYLEAEAEHRAILHLRQRILGPEHADTLATRGNLANALTVLGRHADAEAEHRTVLAHTDRLHGPEHPETLASRSNLAITLRAQGRHAEALEEHRAVLTLRQRHLGAEHPDTLASRGNYANALNTAGKPVAAERENRALLEIFERLWGEDAPPSLIVRSNLAESLHGQQRHAEAETLHRQVLAVRERVLGPDHPHVLDSCAHLAQTLLAQRRPDEALPFAQRAEAERQRILGSEHPATHQARTLVAQIEAQQKAPEPPHESAGQK